VIVVFSARARRELFEKVDWLVARSPAAAASARRRIDEVLERIAEYPEGAPAVGARRQARVDFGHYGFILQYRVRGDEVLIVRVFHGRQQR
jgi:plasmid stabilization system protein ParE